MRSRLCATIFQNEESFFLLCCNLLVLPENKSVIFMQPAWIHVSVIMLESLLELCSPVFLKQIFTVTVHAKILIFFHYLHNYRFQMVLHYFLRIPAVPIKESIEWLGLRPCAPNKISATMFGLWKCIALMRHFTHPSIQVQQAF